MDEQRLTAYADALLALGLPEGAPYSSATTGEVETVEIHPAASSRSHTREKHMFIQTIATALLALTLAHAAHADIYKYRDPKTGKLIISNTPPPAGTDAMTHAEGILGWAGSAAASQPEAAPPSASERTAESAAVIQPETAPPSASERTPDALAFGKSTNFVQRDYWHVQGLVRNTTRNETLRFIKITIKAFDSRGRLVRIEDTYVQPTHLGPGQEGTYKLMVDNHENIARFKTSANWSW